MARQQVARLAGRHHEQRAIEIREVINPSILRSVHGLKLFVGRTASIDGGVVAGAGDRKVPRRSRTGIARSSGWAKIAGCASPQRHCAGSLPKRWRGRGSHRRATPAACWCSRHRTNARRPGTAHADEFGQRPAVATAMPAFCQHARHRTTCIQALKISGCGASIVMAPSQSRSRAWARRAVSSVIGTASSTGRTWRAKLDCTSTCMRAKSAGARRSERSSSSRMRRWPPVAEPVAPEEHREIGRSDAVVGVDQPATRGGDVVRKLLAGRPADPVVRAIAGNRQRRRRRRGGSARGR